MAILCPETKELVTYLACQDCESKSCRNKRFQYERGMIVSVINRNAIGHEQCGDRPAIIVSNDVCNMQSPVLEIVYLTTVGDKRIMPTHVPITSSPMPSTALCEAIYSVDKTAAIKEVLGRCTAAEMDSVNQALKVSLSL